MRTEIYIVFAFLCGFIFVLARTKFTHSDRKISYVPYYASLCVLFSVEPIHIALDEFIGLANFSWLLSYWCLIIGCYLAVRDNLSAWEKPPAYLRKIAIVFTVFLTVVYVVFVRNSPEYAAHDYPRNIGDVLFMLGAYGYTVLVLSIMLVRVRPYRYMLKDEKNAIVRARVFVHDTIYYSILLGFGLKFVLTIILFFYPSLLYGEQLLAISRLLMIFGGNLALLSIVISPKGLIKINHIRSYFSTWLKVIQLWLAIGRLRKTYKVESFMTMNILQAVVRPRLYEQSQLLCISEMIKEIQMQLNITRLEILNIIRPIEHTDLMLLLEA